MTRTLLFLVLSLCPIQDRQAEQAAFSHHDDAAHIAGQCPNGPNCPVKPKPAPEPAPAKPDVAPIVPRIDLSRDDWIALGIGAALAAAALAWRAKRDDHAPSR